MRKLTVDVREDTNDEATIIFRSDGVEVGSIVATLVMDENVRIEGWNGNDTRQDGMILRKKP